MTALLVIGVQTDLLPGGMEAIPGAEGVLQEIQELLHQYDYKILVNYWFPADHKMFASNHFLWNRPGQVVNIGEQSIELSSMYCLQNTFGAENPPLLEQQNFDFKIKLGVEANWFVRSAFSHLNGFGVTQLSEFLLQNEITKMGICGMPLETVVKETALEAIQMGMQRVTVHRKACAGRNENEINQLVKAFQEATIQYY
jgi:nicotinamidase/pyrazinamidase